MDEREQPTTYRREEPPWEEPKAFNTLRKFLEAAKGDLDEIRASCQTQNSPSSLSPDRRVLFALLRIWLTIEEMFAAVAGPEEVKSILHAHDSDLTGKFLQIAHQLFAPLVKFKEVPKVRNLIIYRSFIRE